MQEQNMHSRFLLCRAAVRISRRRPDRESTAPLSDDDAAVPGESYCQLADGRLPGVINDTAAAATRPTFPSPRTLGIGAFMSAPAV